MHRLKHHSTAYSLTQTSSCDLSYAYFYELLTKNIYGDYESTALDIFSPCPACDAHESVVFLFFCIDQGAVVLLAMMTMAFVWDIWHHTKQFMPYFGLCALTKIIKCMDMTFQSKIRCVLQDMTKRMSHNAKKVHLLQNEG